MSKLKPVKDTGPGLDFLTEFLTKHGMSKAHWYSIIPSFSSGKRSEPRLACFINNRSHAKTYLYRVDIKSFPIGLRPRKWAFLTCHYSFFQPNSSHLSIIPPFRKASDTTEICYLSILTVLPEAGKHAFGINGKLGAERRSSTPKGTQDTCRVADQALKGHSQAREPLRLSFRQV